MHKLRRVLGATIHFIKNIGHELGVRWRVGVHCVHPYRLQSFIIFVRILCRSTNDALWLSWPHPPRILGQTLARPLRQYL